MKCRKCGSDVSQEQAIEGHHRECFFEAAQSLRQLDPQDRKRLEQAVEAETAGLIPVGVLDTILETMYDRLVGGEGFDQVLRETSIEILRLAGLGMGREMLKFAEALGGLAREQEEEIRRKMAALARLGKE